MKKKIGVVLGVILLIMGVYVGTKVAFPFLFMKPIADSVNYYHVGNKVYYSPMGNWFELGFEKVKGADYATFEVIGNENAKDAYYVYTKSRVIPGADTDSFAVMTTNTSGSGFSKDKNHVYYDTSIIEGVDVATFQVLDSSFAKDKNRLYSLDQGKVSPLESNPNSFVIFNTYLKKDDLYIYFGDDVVPGADPDSFSFFKKGDTDTPVYWKDKNHVYYNQDVVLGADPKKFKVVYEKSTTNFDKTYYEFGTDGESCYKGGQKAPYYEADCMHLTTK